MNSYKLEFALDTLPSYALIGEIYEIKLCIVHTATKGIGRRYNVCSRVSVSICFVVKRHQLESKHLMHMMVNMHHENW